MAINCKTETQVTMTITGTDHYDLQDQVKEHFGLVEPQFQEERNTCKGYELTKIGVIKILREFDRKFFGVYNHDTGQTDTNIGLIDLKKFVESELGEPQADIPI